MKHRCLLAFEKKQGKLPQEGDGRWKGTAREASRIQTRGDGGTEKKGSINSLRDGGEASRGGGPSGFDLPQLRAQRQKSKGG